MKKEIHIPLMEMVLSFSNAVDLVNRNLTDHHKRVAYISYRIARKFGLDQGEQNNVILAGSLHDLGAISLQERLQILEYELANSSAHAEMGYRILSTFPPLSALARIIRYHHVPWDRGRGSESNGESVPMVSHILHLADRIEILIDRSRDILLQRDEICAVIKRDSDRLYHPDLVEVFLDLSKREAFWLDTNCRDMSRLILDHALPINVTLGTEELLGLARFFALIIDLRSRFTATHSSGVAAVGETLASLSGFSSIECEMMRIAGYLHDLGKLAVPTEILEKNGELTDEEKSVISKHTFYTFRVLDSIQGMETINEWASFHHERLDGSGYPFHFQSRDIPYGARIMAVADIFTAITEDRPYRAGMDREQALDVMHEMVRNGSIDGQIVNLLQSNFDLVNDTRMEAQKRAREEYESVINVGTSEVR